MIDLHCHILPGIDDGSKTIEETKEMLTIAADEDIRVIAATHHFIDDQQSIDSYVSSVDKGISEIQPILRDMGTNIKVVRGAEVFISPFLSQMDDIEMLCINGSQYLLIELPMMDIPQYTEDVIYSLRIRGIIPIIAHPERNHRIMENPNLLYPFIELGALGQVNAGSITGFFGKSVMKCARVLFDYNMAHIISSDAHSPRGRAPRMQEAVHVLRKWVGSEFTSEIINNTPRAILNDVFLEMAQPSRYYKRVFSFPFFIKR